jgi:ADP-ribose pyrophosphatase
MARRVLRTKVFDVQRTFVRINGKRYPWYYLTGNNAVVVMPLIDKDHVVIEKQYRRAVKRYVYEFPAGRIERGESPAAAARRELEEETGYRAGRMRLLFRGYTAPSWHTEVVHYYLATNLKKTKAMPEPTEDIEIEVVKLDDLIGKRMSRGVIDTKSLTLTLFYKSALARKFW